MAGTERPFCKHFDYFFRNKIVMLCGTKNILTNLKRLCLAVLRFVIDDCKRSGDEQMRKELHPHHPCYNRHFKRYYDKKNHFVFFFRF